MADDSFHTVIAFDGTEIHVVETAETRDASAAPDSVTVVMAHGWTLSTRAWRAQAAALAAAGGVRILRYDQRGHGLSTAGAEPFSIDLLGRDLGAVLDQLVPAGPVVLAGHSMGGMTVMALADQRPDLFGGRVAGVLLTNTSAGPLDRLTLGFPEFAARPVRNRLVRIMRSVAASPGRADAVRARQKTGSWFAVAQTRWLLFGRRAPRAAIVECNEIVKACPSGTLAGFFGALMAHDKRAALPNLGGARVEVVAAARDKLTPASHARRLADGIPGARLTTVPGCGHMLPMEQPRAVTEPLVRLVAAARERAAADAV